MSWFAPKAPFTTAVFGAQIKTERAPRRKMRDNNFNFSDAGLSSQDPNDSTPTVGNLRVFEKSI